MAHATDPLTSIQKEIERLELNIQTLQKKIGKIDEKETDPTLSSRLERWEKDMRDYEDKLEKARAKEQQALGFQAQGESWLYCFRFRFC